MNRNDLHQYQVRLAAEIYQNKKLALWVDMGLGKTISTLTAMVDLFDDWRAWRALVIAPRLVACHTWPKEIEAWEHTQCLRYVVVNGSTKQRVAALNTPANIHLISRDLVHWIVDHYGEKWPFDLVVIDESSSFKNWRSRRFKYLKKVLPFIDRMVELTGTPSPKGLLDLWSQIYLLDKGERLGKNITAYKNRWFDQGYQRYIITPKPRAEAEIMGRLSNIVIRMKAEEYLELPDRIDAVKWCDLEAPIMKKYRQFQKQFVLECMDGDEIPANNAAILINKLLQLANGVVYDENRNVHVFHDTKLDALEELIEEANGPVLVGYSYQTDLVRLLGRLKGAVQIAEPGAIDRWNAGKIPILLAHPASAGHGLNLQKGGNTLIWFGLPWSLELYQQFNARLHRQGAVNVVKIFHILCSGTADEKVYGALSAKEATQERIMESVRKLNGKI